MASPLTDPQVILGSNDPTKNPKLETRWISSRPPLADRYWVQVMRTSVPLLASDLLSLCFTTAMGYIIASLWSDRAINHPIMFYFAAAALQTMWMTMHGLYPAAGVHPAVELRQLVLTQLQIAFFTSIFIGGFQDSWQSPYIVIAMVSSILAAVLVPVARSFTRGRFAKFKQWGYPTVLVGDFQTCEEIATIFNRDNRQGLRPLGIFLDSDEYWKQSKESTSIRYLGPITEVIPYARHYHAFWLIIALPDHLDAATKQSYQQLRRAFPHVIVIDSRHELPCLWNRAVHCGGLAAMKVEERLLMPEQQLSKRILDVLLVLLASPLVIPLLLLIALAVMITTGRPVLYFGRRVGRDGREFKAWKFRSMVDNADQILDAYLEKHPHLREEYEKEHKIKNDPRITRFGQFLRKTSLDELPQLWNVLTGDMSLVGPRPILPSEIGKYGTTMSEYATVRPGITGMWQISGRNDTTYEERKEYVRYYVLNWSPWLDLYILARTIKVVLRCEGAY